MEIRAVNPPSTTADIEMKSFRQAVSTVEAGSVMITARGASFAWSADAVPVVEDLTFGIKHGQLCFLIGPVGRYVLSCAVSYSEAELL